jgi:hypothetical protein
MRRVAIGIAGALLAVTLVACSESTSLGSQLLGTWSLAGFDDHGAPGVTTGTWAFNDDATFAARGTVTYPGEPTDSLRVSGTWLERSATSVDLTVAGETTVWAVSFAADSVYLAYTDMDGVVRITLQR